MLLFESCILHIKCHENLSSILEDLVITKVIKIFRLEGTSGEVNSLIKGGLIKSGCLIIFSASGKE